MLKLRGQDFRIVAKNWVSHLGWNLYDWIVRLTEIFCFSSKFLHRCRGLRRCGILFPILEHIEPFYAIHVPSQDDKVTPSATTDTKKYHS